MTDRNEHNEHNSQVEEVFSEASQQVQAGRSIESVLGDYPDYAAELEPMLRLTQRVRTVSRSSPTLSPDALSTIQHRVRTAVESREEGRYPVAISPTRPDEPRDRLQAPARDRRAAPTRGRWFAPFFSTVQVSAPLLALLVVVTGVMLILVAMKLQAGTGAQRSVVAYSGTIVKIEGTLWQVDEAQVIIDDATEIHGQPVVGATMRCIAEPLGTDKMKALEIWVRPTVTPGPGEPSGYIRVVPGGYMTLAP